MRALLIGITVGIGMSLLRAPLGVELVQLAGTTAATGFAFRAAGFALCALAVWIASRRLDGPGLGVRLLGGLALGFALHGLVLGWAPASHRGVVGAGFALLFLAFLFGRAGVGGPGAEPEAEGPTRPGSALGLAMIGAGLALVFELVARPLRWYGGGLPADEALFASCLLIPAAISAFAFRRALAAPLGSAWGRLLGAHGAVLGALAGLWLLSSFGDPRRLHAHLSRVGIDTSEHGMFAFDAWIALPVFALGALGSGALAAGVRRREQWVALVMGGFAGTIASTRVFAADSPFMAENGFEAARAAGVLVCVGAAIASWSDATGGRVAWRLVAGLPVLGAVLIAPLPKLGFHPSWLLVPPAVLWESDTPEGWLAVEVRREVAVVCLDGRPLTPEREQRETERRALHAAWRGKPAGAGKRVLFLGQLDPSRADALLEVGVREVDRCAAWSNSMRELEEQCFAWANRSAPAGRHLSPREARARLAAGEYDFVYAPPVYGRAPGTRQLGAPAGTSAAIVFDGAAPTAERALGEWLVPVQAGLEQLQVVLLAGPHAELGAEAVRSGRSVHREPPWRTLQRREDERPRFERERLARRLALANRGSAAEAETRALALQLMSQRRSSPFESPAERVELPTEALAAWTAAGSADELTALTRSALEDLAVLLVSKRMVEEAREFLTPVADRHWPWPALERALAQSEMELLDPAAALERLGALAEEGGVDGTDWWLLAWVQAAAGDSRAAEESAARARELHLTAPQWEARLAEALGKSDSVGPPPPHSHGGSDAPHDH